MQIFGHSSEAITLRYIGIGEEERKKEYTQNKVGYMEEAEIMGMLNGGKE